MIPFWKKIKKRFRYNSSLKKTISTEDTKYIELFLKVNPEFIDRFAESLLKKVNYNPKESLLRCIVLIQLKNNKTIKVLRLLLESKYVGWKRFNMEYIAIILYFLIETSQYELYHKYSERFGEKDIIVPVGQIDLEFLNHWANRLIEQKRSLSLISDSILYFFDELIAGKLSDKERKNGIINAHEGGLLLWDYSLEDEASKIIKIIAYIKPKLIEQNTLKVIANSLPSMANSIIYRNDNVVKGQNSKAITVIVPSRLIHCSEILRLFPSIDWIESFKDVWLKTAKYIKKACHGSEAKKIPTELALAGNTIARALGLCTSKAAEVIEIYTEDEQIKPDNDQLNNYNEKRQNLVKTYDDLIDEYKAKKEDVDETDVKLEKEIRKLNDAIVSLDSEIEELYANIQHKLSPIYHLLNTLNNSQDYPDSILQAVAWGLYPILRNAKLKMADRINIKESLRIAIYGNDWDDDKLKEKLKELDIFNTELTDDMWNSISDYIFFPDCADISGLKTIDIDKLKKWFENSSNSIKPAFAERSVYFPNKPSLLEIEFYLMDGLNWIIDFIDKHQDPALIKIFKNQIRQIVTLIHEYLPNVAQFLSNYPIRLMDYDYHRKILGNYIHEQCDLIYWTRYQPPLWHEGMPLEKAGEVISRYLSIDDRSVPNSMGIYYRLFEHPLLAIPVFFHEFLHYGGVSGKKEEGITNESEVWIREIIFMQYLKAKLAPDDPAKFKNYELDFLKVVKRLNLIGMAMQLQYDFFRSDISNWFCDYIERLYGKPMDEEDALKEIEEKVIKINREIKLRNNTDNVKQKWFPQIEWTYLSPESPKTDDYKSIQLNRLITSHRISSEDHMHIINEEDNRYYMNIWQNSESRQFTMYSYPQSWSVYDKNGEKAIITVIDRFSITNSSRVDTED